MNEIPILMRGDMVRATLAGIKSQTRRIVKPWQPDEETAMHFNNGKAESLRCPYGKAGDRLWVKETFFDCSKHRHAPIFAAADTYIYRADYEYREQERSVIGCHHWQPSIFMPRQASRLHLDVLKIRVERVQEISEADAIAEGCIMDGNLPKEQPHSDGRGHMGWDSAREWYAWLWDEINAKPRPVYAKKEGKKQIVSYVSYPWSREDLEDFNPGLLKPTYRGKPLQLIENPWVWVIEYKPEANTV